jgi:WD40 repeat protein
MLVTDGADSTYKIWDLTNNNKIPTVVYYDTESPIVSADFRPKDNLHICLDSDGNIITRNVKNQKECIKNRITKEHFNYVKFNPLNDFQYFICTESYFKIYDLRNNIEIGSVREFSNSIDIVNDSKNYLLTFNQGLKLFSFKNHTEELNREWNEFGNVSFCNMGFFNYTNPDVIVVGNENGDVFYSTS